MEFTGAIRVFVEGFSFTRSFTHPCLWESVGPTAFRMYDAPRKNTRDFRSEELVVSGVAPAEADRLSKASMGGRHKICFLLREGEPDAEIRAEFKALGYRLQTTEPFFYHPLADLPVTLAPFPVVRVTLPAQADALARAAGRRQILPEHLAADPPRIRQYMALDGAAPVGWVASVRTTHGAWCSSMFVVESHRRQGIARALLSEMLHGDRAAGASANVLLASHTGAKLYAAAGYRRLGTLYLYPALKR